MKGRKRGCPVNIRNWLIEILDVSTSGYVRIYGLTSMTNTTDSNTEDGSSDTDTWEEPYVTKRNGTVALEGKKVVVESTGAEDPGQDLLNYYANLSGCDADATLRFTDPYGHCWIGDYIVTSHESSADADGDSESWDLSQVGEVEVQPYVNVLSVSMKDGDTTVTTLSLTAGGTAKLITVAFNPETASNKRFKVSNSSRSVAAVSNITENGFTITPVSVGTTTVTVTTVNGVKTASLAVTVSAGT